MTLPYAAANAQVVYPDARGPDVGVDDLACTGVPDGVDWRLRVRGCLSVDGERDVGRDRVSKNLSSTASMELDRNLTLAVERLSERGCRRTPPSFGDSAGTAMLLADSLLTRGNVGPGSSPVPLHDAAILVA